MIGVCRSFYWLAVLGVAAFCCGDSAPGNSSVEDPNLLLNHAIEAIGGLGNISQVKTLSLLGPTSVPQSISVDGTLDLAVVVSGGQNMSYSYGESAIKQRLDRVAALAPPWVFARPSLQPMNYSLLVQGGEDGYAAVVSGSYNIFDPDAPLSGYLDG
ncbi:hypothetical protein BFJ68_g1372 [Fusarium oxysporum]|uniref:Uncharacterized protein n=1 Tax=Fusarium oxysporum TaxID=5507 RepID=A0A420S1L0_FUSOX|nr:hypothetical protein BFJ66_g14824 [Fusarium oxysporum f. sp. cepae]RKL23166.1 hypothetical protein BFJ68_g1372 [Fusarium oxysporum]